MTRADLLAAKAKGHTHLCTFDYLDGRRKIISAHKDYESARKAWLKNQRKVNRIHVLERLLAALDNE